MPPSPITQLERCGLRPTNERDSHMCRLKQPACWLSSNRVSGSHKLEYFLKRSTFSFRLENSPTACRHRYSRCGEFVVFDLISCRDRFERHSPMSLVGLMGLSRNNSGDPSVEFGSEDRRIGGESARTEGMHRCSSSVGFSVLRSVEGIGASVYPSFHPRSHSYLGSLVHRSVCRSGSCMSDVLFGRSGRNWIPFRLTFSAFQSTRQTTELAS